MISLVVVLTYIAVALLAPVITRLLGVDTNYNESLIGDGGMPKDTSFFHSAISSDHLLGIEPVTGRDILAELLYGSRISLLVSFAGTLLTGVIGVTHRHHRRLQRRPAGRRCSAG